MKLNTFSLLIIALLFTQCFTNNLKTQPAATPQKNSAATKQLDTFTDAFVDELANMIYAITTLVTPQALALRDKILQNIVQIYQIISYVNKYPDTEKQHKPILQKKVNEFLSLLEQIQNLMTQQTTIVVEGNNNLVGAKTGYLDGDKNLMAGDKNLMVGDSNTLVGNKTLVSGDQNSIKGNNVVTIGNNNNVTASNAYAFSHNETIDQNNTLTIGNKTVDLVKLNSNGTSVGYLVRD